MSHLFLSRNIEGGNAWTGTTVEAYRHARETQAARRRGLAAPSLLGGSAYQLPLRLLISRCCPARTHARGGSGL
eukprot:COSAG01_NODE_1337_length_10667_cov_77.938115_2_plen_74_part_00